MRPPRVRAVGRGAGDHGEGRGGHTDSLSRGFSLVEVVIAALILGLALVPIIGIVQHSTGQIAAEKAEAKAASYAAEVMNRFLFQDPFSAVNDTGPVEETFEGVTFWWRLEARPINGLKVKYRRIRYHPACGGGAEATAGGGATAAADVEEPIESVDAKFASGGPVLKTLRLEFKWRGPREPTYPAHQRILLLTRRARLE